MIFAAKNEIGESTFKMVLDGRKTVTRRLHPQPVGALRAIQPKRCAKGEGFIQIIGVLHHTDWESMATYDLETNEELCAMYKTEAEAEGFQTWEGLDNAFKAMNRNIRDTYRIEFRRIGGNDRPQ